MSGNVRLTVLFVAPRFLYSAFHTQGRLKALPTLFLLVSAHKLTPMTLSAPLEKMGSAKDNIKNVQRICRCRWSGLLCL